MRLGDEDFTENSFFSFVDMLLEEGITRIVLHPRTRKEKYSRPARWLYIQKLIEHIEKNGGKISQSETIPQNPNTSQDEKKTQSSSISIVGNGCVSDARSYEALCKAAPQMDGIMIGRAAVQKPWIFAELSNIKFIKFFNSNLSNFEKRVYPVSSTIDMYKEAENFTADLIEYQPEEFYATRSKRFFTFFLDNFMYAHYLRSKILNTSVREEQLAYLLDYFEKMPEERFYNMGEN
jgi:tRNA-dihydrouridine synthase